MKNVQTKNKKKYKKKEATDKLNKNAKKKKKSFWQIEDKIHPGKTVAPLDSIGKSKYIDRTASDFENANEKLQKIKRLANKGEYGKDTWQVYRYIPGTLNLMFQRMLENVTTKVQTVHISYRDMKNLEFQILQTQNHYTNPDSFHICFPIKTKKQQM